MFKTSLKSGQNQFLAVLCANIVTVSHGCIVGWLSPTLPILESNESPLESGPITLDEVSWIGSLLALGGIAGNLLTLFISSKIGRKNALSLLAVPHLIFWLIVIYGKYVEHLYIARFIVGMSGGGLYNCIPLFIAEISEPNIRGRLGNILTLAYTFGMLVGFIVGAYLSYFTIPKIMIILPLIFFCCILFFPETPQFLLKCNRVKAAEKSLEFYRNNSDNTNDEYKKLKTEFETLKLLAKQNENGDNRMKIKDFYKRDALKGLFIGLSIMALNSFSGCFTFINYSANIFKQSGSDLDPNACAIIMASIQIIGTYVSTIFVDKIGRKILLIISTTGACLGLFCMGTFSYLIDNDYDITYLNWIPVTSLSWLIFIASVGFLPLSIIILAEVLPINIRATGSSICVIASSIYSFITLKTFPILSQNLKLYGVMWIFAGVCGLGILFSIFAITETKGKDLNKKENSITK